MARLESLLKPHPRVRVLRPGDVDPDGRCVLYWMQRSQRGRENAALNLAIALGNALNLPVLVGFGLTADYPGAERRHYRFLLEGLIDVAEDLARRQVALTVRLGSPDAVITTLAAEVRPAIVVGDENPLRVGQHWRRQVADQLQVPFHLVDADVIVPSSHFPKQEYAARTLRPKINKLLPEYLKPIPDPEAQVPWSADQVPRGEAIDVAGLLARLKVGGASEVPDYRGGRVEAHARLDRFVAQRLEHYGSQRNEPVPYQTSELSGHLHFGHINPLTMALAAQSSGAEPESVASFLEELVVRRELAINYVIHNPDYDRLSGCPRWALETLARHADDPRPVHYTDAQLEAGETGDPIWNAAQKEMILTGRMHNYLRMYWAKKLLHWSPDAQTAFDLAVQFNDRYEMDGRDPNGYVGVAWAIGGLHDRPWPERPIFGTVRYMAYDGIRRKIDADGYVAWVRSIERGRTRA